MTAAEIRALLREYHPSNEWALSFEVGNGTGSSLERHADAVAMNLWPSRGLAIHGFEIKVSRSDWIKELSTPEKADAVARYCDYWWLVTVPGVVKDGELPEGWGLLIAENAQLKRVKRPEKMEAVAVDRAFMAALFRRVHKDDEEAIRAQAKIIIDRKMETIHVQIENAVKARTQQYELLLAQIKEFEELSGVKFEGYGSEPREFARAIRLVHESGVVKTYSGLQAVKRSLDTLIHQAQTISGKLQEALPMDTLPDDGRMAAIPRKRR